ncbi:MAG: hypothetical protein KGI67_05100 [Pseudomonadota bacterium]|nr:hypothetical protein [Pseudomonadota bacterium]
MFTPPGPPLPACLDPLASRVRRLSAGVALGLCLALMVASWCGPQAAAEAVREAYPALRSSWGAPLALATAQGAFGMLEWSRLAGAPARAASTLAPLAPRAAPAALLRALPARVAFHLCALALWLGLLQPLAWIVSRWYRRQQRDREASAGVVRAGRSAAACCVLLALCWLAAPLLTLRWAPLLAAAWLAAHGAVRAGRVA